MLSLVCGCSGDFLSTIARQPVVNIDEVALDILPDGVSGSIAATVVNKGARELFLSPCGYSIVRQVGSESVAVWASICSLEDVDRSPLLPGEARSITVKVSAVFGFAVAEEWHAPVAGEYRLHVALADEEGTLPPSLTMSEPFSIPAS
jgi:hypothetical protein